MPSKPSKTAGWAIVAGLVLALPAPAAAQVTDNSIQSKMGVLQPLVGSWDIAATFHGRKGETSLDSGTFEVKPILGGSYLEIDATLIPKAHPERAHSFMQLITFNPETKKYDVSYFYSRSALRVSEQGQFDLSSHDFTTAAYIPREDGVRNENVHTALRILDPQHLKYTHFSRYDDESKETMDLEIQFTRTK